MDPDQPADLDIQFLKQDISRLSMVMVKYSWNIYKDNEQSYVIFYMSRAMGKCVFGVNLAILRFCDFYTGHYMKSKLAFV